ncbi:efflux RND transporter periplasmic adaptor subunit [Parabacteroides sp. Marseille-P3160]|uniref:efflux RND transporter periplasmic adaptor subunit n=1 Tax=Parabacteroides sp. Marseille-P3160 TaxID=1917887 RepID=UPI0009BB775F|nr:efflux RND transporter periplasmic adaptor subunit [Parabacteroides sp. Marseille-P3160]
MNKKKIILGAICILLIAGGIYLFRKKTSGGKMRLEMVTVTRSSISNVVTATGTVEPVVLVEVGTQVSGIIDKIYVDYNDQVKKGEIIAEMDKVTLQSELASQQATLAVRKTEYDYQQRNYARSKTLHEKSLISDSEYETATYNYETSKNNYESTKATLEKATRNLGYATITSPIDGVVISRAVEEGQTVASGFSTPTLFTIANDLTQMRVIANVDEADIGGVEVGQKVTFNVDAYPNDTFEGKVTQVRLEATTESNVVTYEVVISAYNPDLKLKPGLTANVTIYTLERNNVLTVPIKSLRFVPDEKILASIGLTVKDATIVAPSGKKIVWQREDNVLVPRTITTGTTSGSIIEVEEGLKEGEEIVESLASSSTPVTSTIERSPFAPSPPGGNKNNSKK